MYVFINVTCYITIYWSTHTHVCIHLNHEHVCCCMCAGCTLTAARLANVNANEIGWLRSLGIIFGHFLCKYVRNWARLQAVTRGRVRPGHYNCKFYSLARVCERSASYLKMPLRLLTRPDHNRSGARAPFVLIKVTLDWRRCVRQLRNSHSRSMNGKRLTSSGARTHTLRISLTFSPTEEL